MIMVFNKRQKTTYYNMLHSVTNSVYTDDTKIQYFILFSTKCMPLFANFRGVQFSYKTN